MSPPTVAECIQIATLVILGLTLIAIWLQQRAGNKHVLLDTITSRMQLYLALTAKVTDEEVDTMLLHLPDHMDRATYDDRYQGHPARIKSYLLMKRKYLYLAKTLDLEEHVDLVARGGSQQWAAELCQYQEFRDVHKNQKHYYPRFATQADSFLRETEVVGWMVDHCPLPCHDDHSNPGEQQTELPNA